MDADSSFGFSNMMIRDDLFAHVVQQASSAPFNGISSKSGRSAVALVPSSREDIPLSSKFRVPYTGYPGGAEFSSAIRIQLEEHTGLKLGAHSTCAWTL